MHGGEIDEGYCIINGDALEDSMTPTPDSKKNCEEYFKGVDRMGTLFTLRLNQKQLRNL
jgi:hypothetical protein